MPVCPLCGASYDDDPGLAGCPVCLLRIGLRDAPEADTETVSRPTASEKPRQRIGPYTLLEVLGVGGMGVVFLAEQHEPIHRRVAVKVIRAGLCSPDVLARFEAEREALALMGHPSIAAVFDAGTTDDGRPFVVMEYVPGMPITEYCDRHRLDLRHRLGLFREVCGAVQHAHHKGIVHRDLKPSNVLVTEVDGEPRVKVIDFGLAKALHGRLTDAGLLTRFGVVVGTPAYMSPEQISPTPLDIDTRTDVYSLGVLLYELLAGALPFDVTAVTHDLVKELRHLLLELEPEPPSRRVEGLGERAAEVADHRGVDATTLRRLLRDDLDWIVLRALERDRARRYQSAGELAADLERHLDGDPVSAGPPSALYRIRKLARRHRRTAVAAAAVLVAILTGGTTSGILYIRARTAAAEAALQRDLATLEASRSALEASALQAALDWDLEEWIDRERAALQIEPTPCGDPSDRARRIANALAILSDPGSNPAERAREGAFAVELLAELEELAPSLGLTDRTRAVSMVHSVLDHHQDVPDAPKLEDLALGAVTTWAADLPESSLQALRRHLVLALEMHAKEASDESRHEEALSLLERALALRSEWLPRDSEIPAVQIAVARELIQVERLEEADLILAASLDRTESEDGLALQQALFALEGRSDLAARIGARRLVVSIRDLGPIKQLAWISDRGPGHSVAVEGRSMWVFGETHLIARPPVPTSAAWARFDRLGHMVLEWPHESFGEFPRLLELSPDEALLVAQRNGDGVRLVPGAMAWDPRKRRVLLTYAKVVFDPRAPVIDRTPVGYSIALWGSGDGSATRPIVHPGTPEPTLLFRGGGPGWGAAAVVEDDHLYVYGCAPGDLRCPCWVARCSLGRVLEPDAWRFWSDRSGWIADSVESTPVLDAAPVLSVSLNRHLGRFIAVYSVPFTDLIALRTAPRLEGPWSEPRVIATTQHTVLGSQSARSALEHPELARGDGRVLTVSYIRDTGSVFATEMRRLEVELR